MQEARWDVRKPFSGSICQERVEKRERERERETPKALGNIKAFRERPVLFREYCYSSQSIQQLYPAALEMGSEDMWVTSSVFPHGHV